jgi:acetoacetate decarboxylase
MINARYGDAVGTYFLTLVVSGDMPVTLGRELWGEPKKPGTAQLFRDGNALYGYGERHGTRIIEIEATFTQNLGPKRTDSHALELAGALTDDGRLLGDAAAIVFAVDRRMDSVRCGHGELRLTGTQFDPVSEIPIVSTGLALHYTGEAAYQQISRTPLADGEDYLPYILGRNFDDLYRFRRPTRHRDLVGAPDTVAPTLTDRRQ